MFLQPQSRERRGGGGAELRRHQARARVLPVVRHTAQESDAARVRGPTRRSVASHVEVVFALAAQQPWVKKKKKEEKKTIE